nr:TetR family transcriptional regulator [Nocardia cerradoensis]
MRTALEMFAERGYHAVSVREISEQVGLTKTAVLYHFSSKIDIVVALVEPLLADTEAMLESVRTIRNPDARRWAVAEGLLDTWLRHRSLLRIHMQDQALSADTATYRRLRDIALTAQGLLAGLDADFTSQVRAAQIYAALSDPVVFFADRPEKQLRAAILDGVHRLLGGLPPRDTARTPERPVTTSQPRTARGRPGAMTPEMVESARHMRDSGEYTVDQIAATLGVSRATVYRNLTTSNDRPTVS